MVKKFSEVKMSYRTDKRYADLPYIRDPESAADLLYKIWDKKTIELREEFVVLLLSSSKRCIGWYKVSTGTQTATLADPASIFRTVLLSNANTIVLCHNHPSGNITPSQADMLLTKRLVDAGKLLDIQVEDHIILCPNGRFVSMRNKGLI